MRKNILIISILLLMLSACNFPLVQTKTNDADVVSTRVAMTLQAAVSTQIVTQTPSPITATPTYTVLPTQTMTSTPTQALDDPAITLGTPTFSDSFSSGSAFGLKTPYFDDAITMSIENDAIHMVSSRLNGGTRWRLAYLTPRNLYLEGTFKTMTCSTSDFYGIVARMPDYSAGTGYYFAITCGGQYALLRMDGTYQMHTIINWTTDPSILSGSGQENRIGLMLVDDQIKLYVNGKLINETSNNVITQKGYFGVFQSAVSSPNMTVDVEEIKEWDRP